MLREKIRIFCLFVSFLKKYEQGDKEKNSVQREQSLLKCRKKCPYHFSFNILLLLFWESSSVRVLYNLTDVCCVNSFSQSIRCLFVLTKFHLQYRNFLIWCNPISLILMFYYFCFDNRIKLSDTSQANIMESSVNVFLKLFYGFRCWLSRTWSILNSFYV